jgi:hypothetical protein
MYEKPFIKNSLEFIILREKNQDIFNEWFLSFKMKYLRENS